MTMTDTVGYRSDHWWTIDDLLSFPMTTCGTNSSTGVSS